MPRARSRSSLIALEASTRALRTSSAASGCSSRRSSARPSCMLSATSRACAPSCRSRSIRRSSAAWASSAPRRVRVSTSTRSLSSRSRAGCSARHHDVTSACRPSAIVRPNSGQKSQKPKPVSAQTKVNIPATHGRQPGVGVQRSPLSRPLRGPSDCVLHREWDREPEPDPDRPEITEPGSRPDHHHHEHDQGGHPELHRVHDPPVDLAARLVRHQFIVHDDQDRAAGRVSRWGAMASATGAVPTPGYHRPPMPAADPPSRKPPSSSAPERR